MWAVGAVLWQIRQMSSDVHYGLDPLLEISLGRPHYFVVDLLCDTAYLHSLAISKNSELISERRKSTCDSPALCIVCMWSFCKEFGISRTSATARESKGSRREKQEKGAHGEDTATRPAYARGGAGGSISKLVHFTNPRKWYAVWSSKVQASDVKWSFDAQLWSKSRYAVHET
ncbi:hypothetical protein HYPSUDRAFT_693351 [Hypholoma sublateritium FD-334 SS-4]|uniref:Uncharacterized protein n=1 Tax=Hypholoma sublateritium (strain FD-334 SS-4) TaxID=945553 RepID=A0A0D2PIN4_HYPSF|nr:hypothetical protein HYPSUDRAFT_693351 [Hypholoma sublateritium FD-334 SS-4]